MVFSLFLIAFCPFSHISFVYKIFFSPLQEKWHSTVAFFVVCCCCFGRLFVCLILSGLMRCAQSKRWLLQPRLVDATLCRMYVYMNFVISFLSPFYTLFAMGIVALLLRSYMRNKIESHKILNGIAFMHCDAMEAFSTNQPSLHFSFD